MAPTDEELIRIAVERIISRAKDLTNDPDLDKRRDVFEPAKWAIGGFTSSPEEYQQAVSLLREKMKI